MSCDKSFFFFFTSSPSFWRTRDAGNHFTTRRYVLRVVGIFLLYFLFFGIFLTAKENMIARTNCQKFCLVKNTTIHLHQKTRNGILKIRIFNAYFLLILRSVPKYTSWQGFFRSSLILLIND